MKSRVTGAPTTSQPSTSAIVAVLDALGAKNYSEGEVKEFLESRKRALTASTAKAERHLKVFAPARFKSFFFNDTVVLAYLACELEDIETFCHVLRAFQWLSLKDGLLFRGAVAIGTYYVVDQEQDAVMGPVVSDAASWYDKADWIGIAATPKASLTVEGLLERQHQKELLEHVLVDYDIPLKDKRTIRLKAINWPKAPFVTGLSGIKGQERADLLQSLARHDVPPGAEDKYHNTIKFFDYVYQEQNLLRLSAPSPSLGPSDDV